jgi:hypothetical protein
VKSILDPSFRYVASFDTDLSKTFERIRRDRRKDMEEPMQHAAAVHASALSIVKKTGTDK